MWIPGCFLIDCRIQAPSRRAGPAAIPVPFPMAAFWGETLGLSPCCGSGWTQGMLLYDLFAVCLQSASGREGTGRWGLLAPWRGVCRVWEVCAGGKGPRRGEAARLLAFLGSPRWGLEVNGGPTPCPSWVLRASVRLPCTLRAQFCFFWLVQAPQPPCDSSR